MFWRRRAFAPEIFDWTDVPDEALTELQRQAETYLAGTMTIATASDQRAGSLCAMFGGGGVALLVAAASVYTGSRPEMSLVWSTTFVGAWLLIATFMQALAAHTRRFFIPGFDPKYLLPSTADAVWLQRYIIEDCQMRIDANRAAIARAAGQASIARWCAVIGVLGSVVLFVVLADHATKTPPSSPTPSTTSVRLSVP